MNNFNLNNYQVSIENLHDKQVIAIQFPYDKDKINELKNFCKPSWSASKKYWWLPDSSANRKLFNLPLQTIGKDAYLQISEINRAELQKLVDLLHLRAYSPATLKTYAVEFMQLLKFINDHPVQDLNSKDINAYLLMCIHKLKLSENALHSRINAIKFYFEQVLQQPQFVEHVIRPKKPSTLPKVLSKTDIKKMIALTENLKHKIILQLVYGMGLRVSEVVNLKVSDIDSQRMQVFIERAKGKKDRYANLPEAVLENLRGYYKQYRPNHYLLEGEGGAQYSIRSVQQVFKSAMNRAGIKKPIGIHGLRHSYATHLFEAGTDVSLIQKLLGHNNIKTTLGYLNVAQKHVSLVKSPLDTI